MTLTGTYLRSLDEKRRVPIPKRLRDDFGDQPLDHLLIAPGTNHSLVLYGPRQFAALAESFGSKPFHQNYLRLFYSSAERVDLDSQGRIRIPDRLAEHARLNHELYLLGVQDHAEVWDRVAWDEFSQRLAADFDQLAWAAWGGTQPQPSNQIIGTGGNGSSDPMAVDPTVR
jgi:MraZ protein